MGTTSTRRHALPDAYGMEDDDALYETRMPSSSRRYRPHATTEDHAVRPDVRTGRRHKPYDTMDDPVLQPARRYKPQDTMDDPTIQKEVQATRRAVRSPHSQPVSRTSSDALAPGDRGSRKQSRPLWRNPLVALSIGIIIATLLLITANTVNGWWQEYQNALHYGYPRTSHLDAVVGHNDSPNNKTHFIFFNLNGKIQIVEIPGGDTTKTRVFQGPTLLGPDRDLIPVTGTIRIEDGKYNLVIHIQNQQIVYENDGETFHRR